MRRPPLVSVIIPTFNRADYLAKAVESVRAQTYPDWELIVVDDESVDPTRERMRLCCARDDRIQYFRQNRQGVSVSRNMGIRRARGAYVAFLDDDDLWLPEKLKTQVEMMESDPAVGLTYSRFRIARFVDGRMDGSKALPLRLATTFADILWDCWISTSTVMIRRSCFDHSDWFNPLYPIAQDIDLWLRLVQRWRIAALAEPLAMTIKDGRERASEDILRSTFENIRMIRCLDLTPEYRRYRGLLSKYIAFLEYRLGDEYRDRQRYGAAALHFARSIWMYPRFPGRIQCPVFRKEQTGPCAA